MPPFSLMKKGRSLAAWSAILLGLIVSIPLPNWAKEEYSPVNLLCEYIANPLGIDVPRPRFSWTITHPGRAQFQSAYQILVASHKENLDANHGNLWDSQKAQSDQSVNIVYAGQPLKSGKTYYWKVRTWDKDGQVSQWSKIASFEMGLLNPEDWLGQWIGFSEAEEKSPLLRREFNLAKSVARACAYISGLGYYELHINGKKVGDNVLDPGWTDYAKRILYVTYDVTSYLTDGLNAIGIMLGNGWYNPRTLDWFEAPWRDFPKVILQMNIDFTDGSRLSIVTDESWKVSSGPIITNTIYDGETYDARLEKPGWDTANYDDSTWDNAEIVEDPGGVMKAQLLPPIRVVKTIKPVAVTNPGPGVWVFDLGQNFAGWVRLKVEGPRGTEVVLKFAEVLSDDGMINQENLRTAQAKDTYILKGEGKEVYEPKFTYHGFRYVEMTGFPGTPTLDNLEGRVVHSSVETVGEFSCSNSLLNQIHRNILWTRLANLMSIPTDCPQRDERLGWLGDALYAAETSIYNFDLATFNEKWASDLEDAQEETGNIPDVVPDVGVAERDPAWGSECIFIPYYNYLYYGDQAILEQHYQMMKKWICFLQNKATDGILSYGWPSDWCAPGQTIPLTTPVPLVSTFCYYEDALLMSEMARTLGKSVEAGEYAELVNFIRESFQEEFYNGDGEYATGSQTCQVLPLTAGIVPESEKEAVVKKLVDNVMIEHTGHLDTGMIGTRYLLDVLTDCGYGDVAYTIAAQTTYPSWGYMISKGATTLWELWEYKTVHGMNSHNHIMFGSIDAWFYKFLAGIRVDPDGPGFRKIIIKPHPLGDLEWVAASVKTIRGLIASRWKKQDNLLTLNVVLPTNSQAKVNIPKIGLDNAIVEESGKIIWKDHLYIGGAPGITGGEEDAEYVTFDIGSGSYSFKIYGTK